MILLVFLCVSNLFGQHIQKQASINSQQKVQEHLEKVQLLLQEQKLAQAYSVIQLSLALAERNNNYYLYAKALECLGAWQTARKNIKEARLLRDSAKAVLQYVISSRRGSKEDIWQAEKALQSLVQKTASIDRDKHAPNSPPSAILHPRPPTATVKNKNHSLRSEQKKRLSKGIGSSRLLTPKQSSRFIIDFSIGSSLSLSEGQQRSAPLILRTSTSVNKHFRVGVFAGFARNDDIFKDRSFQAIGFKYDYLFLGAAIDYIFHSFLTTDFYATIGGGYTHTRFIAFGFPAGSIASSTTIEGAENPPVELHVPQGSFTFYDLGVGINHRITPQFFLLAQVGNGFIPFRCGLQFQW
jgi:hypothetical protein